MRETDYPLTLILVTTAAAFVLWLVVPARPPVPARKDWYGDMLKRARPTFDAATRN